mgnify:CR=1 FL=1
MDDKNKKIKVADVVQDGGEEVLNLKTKVFIEPKIAVKPEIVEKPEAIAKTEPVLASLSPKIVFEKYGKASGDCKGKQQVHLRCPKIPFWFSGRCKQWNKT